MHTTRRDFLASTAALAAAATIAQPPPAESAQAPRDYYELRAYRLKPGAPHTLLDSYLERALIPALNTRGIRAVGVFTEPDAPDGAAIWVLIPHSSLASLGAVNAEINADPIVLAAGHDYLSTPTKDKPGFDRVDSWVYLAFSDMPVYSVPALARSRESRIFELRIYESHSELKALKKVAMFNAGEIEVMQQLQLSPVFYGQALAGRDLPQLAYLLCSPDRATHARNWQRFLDHPTWLRLKADPQYADTVSKITSRFLIPTGYSQL
jgi:hypothetical protein